MNLKTFEQQFNPIILNRGYHYYIDGHVKDVIQINATNWQAEIIGTQRYVVDIQMNINGDIIYTDCDCPYDVEVCKHIAATLYAIRDDQPKEPVIKTISLHERLQTQTKTQLIELITTIGQNHPSFLQELELALATPETTLGAAEKLITHYIDEATDYNGHIPWHDSHEGTQGIDTVHQQIAKLIENEDYFFAIELSLLCFRLALDVIEISDDHDGSFCYTLEKSTMFIEQAVWEGIDYWNESQYEKVYSLILKDASNRKLQNWSEYRIPLLQTCIPLCQNDTIEVHFLEKLHSFKIPANNWNANYMNSQLRTLQLELISSKYGQEEIEAFLENNVDDATMREHLISLAMERNDFHKVLRLALDGITQDYNERGTVNKWKRFAYKASKKLNDIENMRKYAIELVQDGDIHYYEELKLLYRKEEWSTLLEQLLDALHPAKPHIYEKIIVAEKKSERILHYCQEQPSRVEKLYPYITEHYYEDVCTLFTNVIAKKTPVASNRKQYRDICNTIRTMQKAGCTFEANQLITRLMQRYSNRPAFLDELQQLM